MATIVAAVLLTRCGGASSPSSAVPVAQATPSAAVARPTPTPTRPKTRPSAKATARSKAAARSTVPAPAVPKAAVPPAATPKQPAGVPVPAGWEQVFADDFTSPSLVPPTWWVYDAPNAAQGFSKTRVKETGGELQILGGLDAQGRNLAGGIGGGPDLMYGRWEARIRVDAGAGYNAVGQLWPESGDVNGDGEVGFLVAQPGGPSEDTPYVHSSQTNAVSQPPAFPVDLSTWRTIAVEWMPDHITVSIDGRTVYSLRRPASGADPIPDTGPMHLTFQLDKVCCRTASTPALLAMHVDWVRVYRPKV